MANCLGRRSDDFAGFERFAILTIAEEVSYTPMNSGWRPLIPELEGKGSKSSSRAWFATVFGARRL